MFTSPRTCFLLTIFAAVCAAAPLSAAESDPVDTNSGSKPPAFDFDRQIRPILSEHCFTCHGPDASQRKGGLRLDTREGALGDRGGYHAVVPGDLAASAVWERLTTDDADLQMPPANVARRPSGEEIARLKSWIESGAPWEEHWSLRPVQRPATPSIRKSALAENAIDAFVLNRLETVGLSFSPRASRATLLRRLSLDLTGLPPTLVELDAFLADQRPGAYERQVDRLLSSPRYGEAMLPAWLDAARYADSNGYQTDGTRAMWPWRDRLLASLNGNQAFDQFTIEQIAGDMLPNATLDQVLASGFHRNHMLNGEGGRIAEESRVEYVVDRVHTTATVWLGLTAGCARCHDHKYDPLSQQEFYQLYAYFNNVDESGGVDRRSGTAAPTVELPTPEQERQRSEFRQALASWSDRLKVVEATLVENQPSWESQQRKALEILAVTTTEDDLERNNDHEAPAIPPAIARWIEIDPQQRSDEQRKKLREYYLSQDQSRQKILQEQAAAQGKLDAVNRAVLITMVMGERAQQRATHILDRGLYDQPRQQVEPALPGWLPPLPQGAPNNRLGLAQWLVDRANPLSARVTVNRIWQHFFGVGLVRTPEDFGTQGERPTHPELLDYLAWEFQQDWDVKRLQRLILTSGVYRQSSQVTDALLQRDPENRLLTRAARSRLNSLTLRDQALALAGLLVEQQGGPPVQPYQPPGIWEEFSFNKIKYQQDLGEKLYRRSVYIFWRRSIGPTNLFDTTPRQVCTVSSGRTNSPLHSLIMFNDVTYAEAARLFGERMIREGGNDPRARLNWAFRLATARMPTPHESQILLASWQRNLDYFRQHAEEATQWLSVGEAPRSNLTSPAEHAAYASVASLILNLDEVLTRE